MSKKQHSEILFVGYRGLIKTLKRTSGKIMFVPDANLVLSLLQEPSYYKNQSTSYNDYLRVTRNKAYKSWNIREKWIPIDPVLGIMELTKQDKNKDYKKYELYFNDFYKKVYNIKDFHPEWVRSTYELALKAVVNTHPSIKLTIENLYQFISDNDKPTDAEIIANCNNYIKWIWAEKDNLSFIGGILAYVAIFAIAGSPDARQILKVNIAKKQGASKTANNVAWDFLYLMTIDINYYSNKYDNTILCTADKPLAKLLGGREHTGPRYSPSEVMKSQYIEAGGNLKIFKFKRLENTKLERLLSEKLINLQLNIEQHSINQGHYDFNDFLFVAKNKKA